MRLTVAIQPKEVSVPDVVGSSQNAASRRLSRAGFEVAVEQITVDSSDQDGQVRKQSPAPGGDKVKRGSTVTITIGRYEPAAEPEPEPQTTTTTPTTTTPAPPR